jgi:copper chaperone
MDMFAYIGRAADPRKIFGGGSMQLYKVPKMSCDGCVRTIEVAVKSLDPQAKISCDLQTREVAVDTRTLPKLVAEALAAVGYPSTLLEA